jgi:hypothetical protein
VTYTVEVLKGLAQLIADAGIAVYKTSGSYTAADRGVYFSEMPTGATQAVSLTRYLDQPGALGQNNVMVQIRTRLTQNPLEGEAVVDQIRDLLHRRTYTDLGGYRFNLISQESFAPLGKDANGRYQYTQNFLLTGTRGSRI